MTKTRSISVVLILAMAILLTLNASTQAGEIAIKTGEKMAFMGDSITAGGWRSPTGYIHLVLAGLKANDINVTPIPAGVGGNKSNQMLARLDKDVISKKPNWMSLSCGVNDVWHGKRGVNLEDYKKNITEIVDKSQAAGIKVMLLTSTMITENPETPLNKKLADYNAFLTQLAKEKNLLIADLNADMRAIVKAHQKSSGSKANFLTRDGVHMNEMGDLMMAKGILEAFGLDSAQMQKAEDAWNKLTASKSILMNISLGNCRKLQQLPAQRQKEIMKQASDAASKIINDAVESK